MSMGSMAVLPPLETWPTFYWAVVGSAIAIATVVNIYNEVLYRQRLSAARAGIHTPAKPRSWLASWNATLYAFTREASNFSVHIPLKNTIIRLPTVGRTTLIVLNIIVLVVLCLYGLELNNVFTRESVGFRCGVVTISQLPLIFLLAGKNNIIGHLSGISYERLNWLHRWCARCMLLTATMHMGYFISAWAPFDYVGYQLKNNRIVWKGLASWCTLVWIVFSSAAPIRGWCYELFVMQHIISFTLFLSFIYIHTPTKMHVYVWISVGVFAFDRVFRLLRIGYANVSLFHPSLKKQGPSATGFLTCQAEFTPLPHDTTHIVIRNPPIDWAPGQHVFLSCQSIAPLQNHPFTIASIPEDGRMDFFVKAEKGGTRQLFTHAEKRGASSGPCTTRAVTIEGPYGCLRPLRQFDSVVLLAGSTGATHIVPLLRDLIQGWEENGLGLLGKNSGFFRAPRGAATRHIRFVWVVKSRAQLQWFSEQLSSVYTKFQTLQEKLRDIKLELTVYITCDETFTEEQRPLRSTMAAPDLKSALGPGLEHGKVQYRESMQSGNQEHSSGSEKGITQELKTFNSIDINGQQVDDDLTRSCCCRNTIDETAPSDSNSSCCCTSLKASRRMSRPASLSPSTPRSVNQSIPIHPMIKVLSGRPQTKGIIRRSLEQAMGESAVVVCGPDGLVADVKQHVCVLSDERAVHKGTGAQGIYLHTESYSY